MYALTVKTRKQLERACLRSQARKPKVQEVVFGIYKVWSTNPKTPGTFYLVGIEPAQDGGEGYDVCCTCPTQPKIDFKTGELVECFCYHVTSALPTYQMKEREYRAEELRMAASQVQVQVMTDAEWAAVELAVETEAMLDDVREMLERDREQKQVYTEEMARKDREDIFG